MKWIEKILEILVKFATAIVIFIIALSLCVIFIGKAISIGVENGVKKVIVDEMSKSK